jgi:hypothetical protein
MLAFDNLNADTAEIIFAVAFFLAVIAAVAYAVRRPDATVWAPVLLALSVAGLALGFWVV